MRLGCFATGHVGSILFFDNVCQVFQLVPVPGGQGFFCYNDVFRLVYG